MEITFDRENRDRTLRERGLAFEDAAQVFDARMVTVPDRRLDYGEPRFQTFGRLGDRIVLVVWTPRPGSRRIISMRYASDRERSHLARRMGGSG